MLVSSKDVGVYERANYGFTALTPWQLFSTMTSTKKKAIVCSKVSLPINSVWVVIACALCKWWNVCVCVQGYNPENCIPPPRAYLSGANYCITIRHKAFWSQLELGFNWIGVIGLLHLKVELKVAVKLLLWGGKNGNATASVGGGVSQSASRLTGVLVLLMVSVCPRVSRVARRLDSESHAFPHKLRPWHRDAN